MTLEPTARVTVIIPTFNRAMFIDEAIESILDQTHKPHQIIVSDDGSTDETSTVVARYGDRVTYVKNENGGKSKAINRISHLIEGDFVWIFDDDDIAEKDALARLLEPHTNNPNLDYSFGYIIPKRFKRKEEIIDSSGKKIPEIFSHESHLYNLTQSNYIFLNACLIRKSRFEKSLPFNEEMIRSQDYEFLIRLSLDAEVLYVHTPVFYLRIHDGIRGSLRNPVPYKLRGLAWEKYDKKVGQFILDHYPDSAFLHPDLRGKSRALQARSIEIRKSYIASNKGLYDRAHEHLAKAYDFNFKSNLDLEEIDEQNITELLNQSKLLEHLLLHKEKMKSLFKIAASLASIDPFTLASKRMYWSAMNAANENRIIDAASQLCKSVYFLLASRLYFPKRKPRKSIRIQESEH